METAKKKFKEGSQGPIRAENFFRRSLVFIALVMVVLVVGIFLTLIVQSIPSLKALGIKYLWGKTWDPVNNIYGALPFMVGTLLTSFIALIIAMPFSYAIAVYLGEFNTKGWLSNLLKNIVDLIAAVPSVIYGFWGFLILVPAVQKMEMAWNAKKIGEYRTLKPDDNKLVINGDSLMLNRDYIPLAYSGSASIDDTSVNAVMQESTPLPDSVKQGHPFIFDIGPVVAGNKGKPVTIIYDSIKQAEARASAKGAAALLVINSSGIADSLQFNKKDTTSPLDIAVVYITDAARKKHFAGGTNASYSANIHASVAVIDPYNIDPYGTGIFTASVILAVMIIPYAAAMGRELIKMVPSSLKEGAYALGATRYEVIKSVVIPYTKSGLAAGVLLSLGRALGETMAVTMVIGNSSIMPKGIFSLGHTMASVIANEYAEADHTVYLSALSELGLVLFLLTVTINMIGKGIIKRFTHE
jgi:ABC-type phosphate transport system permease subunit